MISKNYNSTSDYIEALVKENEVLIRELDRANGFHESAAGKLFDSGQECKQLKAQNERYRTHMKDLADRYNCSEWIHDPIEVLLNETPALSLANIEASAIYHALCMVYHEEDDHRGYYSYEGLKLHADHIRQQAKESIS